MAGTNGQPDALKMALENMPSIMEALMKDFITKKDVTSRIHTRLRMKALLDFAGVDTEWPPNPMLKKEVDLQGEPARNAAIRDGQALGLMQMQAYAPDGLVTHGAPPTERQPGQLPVTPRVGIDNTDLVR